MLIKTFITFNYSPPLIQSVIKNFLGDVYEYEYDLMTRLVADLRGREGRAPPGPNSFNFMQFLGKFGKIVC